MKREKDSSTERVLDIWVQPRASGNQILGYRGEFLRIRVTAAAMEGAANRLCREVLAEALGVPPSRVEILKGHKARRKRVRIKDLDAAHWQRLGKEWASGR